MAQARGDCGPKVGGLRRRAAGEERLLRTQPGQLARALRTRRGVCLYLRGAIARKLIERERFQLFHRHVRHRAPSSRYPARLARIWSRARWISFFTFCSGHPIAAAISP